MGNVDFSSLRSKRLPTRKERGLYRQWVGYLQSSSLTSDEIHTRASQFAEQHKPVPND
ncbi:hypothetical protein [Sphingomonas sp. 3-13AW]|uniref:hypothetical protein n=1 Tax=Sphingomonas sp. 3-13AW TaxID=3050450 RepID=UPI003BB4C507